MWKKHVVLLIIILAITTITSSIFLLSQTTQGQADLESQLSQEELSMDKMIIEPTPEDEALAAQESNESSEWIDELVLTEHDKQTIASQSNQTLRIAGMNNTNEDSLTVEKMQFRTISSPEEPEVIEKDKYIAIVGDSFSAPGQDFYWPKLLEDATGYNLINKAQNSTGFTIGSTTFEEQLEQIAADENFDKVEHLIVYGGINDFQSGASISQTIAAIEKFWNRYKQLEYKPELHIAFGNVGYAQRQKFNGFYEWYTAIEQVLANDGIAGLTPNVPYWHFNEPECFFDDLIHPNVKGQKMIAVYMTQMLNGSYTGVQRTNWYDGVVYNGEYHPARKTIHFDNGVVTVTVKMEENIRLRNLESNTFIDLGEITNYSRQYSLMFGTDNTNNPVIWIFDSPVYESYKDEKFGILRPMFNVANKHLYFQMFGYAGAYKDRIADMNQLQMSFVIYPTNW